MYFGGNSDDRARRDDYGDTVVRKKGIRDCWRHQKTRSISRFDVSEIPVLQTLMMWMVSAVGWQNLGKAREKSRIQQTRMILARSPIRITDRQLGPNLKT